ncbi:hypothetical protein LMG26840_04964 [Achromobacter dolens]|nr:hypothetical protein LMG26840_04964 [Achromobacter dolens]
MAYRSKTSVATRFTRADGPPLGIAGLIQAVGVRVTDCMANGTSSLNVL